MLFDFCLPALGLSSRFAKLMSAAPRVHLLLFYLFTYGAWTDHFGDGCRCHFKCLRGISVRESLRLGPGRMARPLCSFVAMVRSIRRGGRLFLRCGARSVFQPSGVRCIRCNAIRCHCIVEVVGIFQEYSVRCRLGSENCLACAIEVFCRQAYCTTGCSQIFGLLDVGI
jgi:hypothetical protein